MDRQTDGWTDGWMDERHDIIRPVFDGHIKSIGTSLNFCGGPVKFIGEQINFISGLLIYQSTAIYRSIGIRHVAVDR